MHIGSFDFQKQVLKALISDNIFSVKIIDYLKKEHFNHIDMELIFEFTKDFTKQYGKVPDIIAIKETFKRNDDALDLIDEIEKINYNKKFVEDQIISFIKVQEWKLFGLKLDKLILGNEFEELRQESIRISNINISREKNYRLYLENASDRMRRDSNFVNRPTGTGIHGIDEILDSGGLADGELGLIAAPPNGGKSTALIVFGKNCLFTNNNVLHFTLEMSDRKIMRRYDQSILKMTKEELYRTPRRALNRFTEICSNIKKQLIVQEFPSYSKDVNSLKVSAEKIYDLTGMNPDVILVDYADLLLPSRKYDGRRFELENIYTELRGMAQYFGCKIWTGSQSDTSTIMSGKGKIGMENLHESKIGKASIVDVMISVNQSIDQKKMGRGSLYIAKNRDGDKNISISVKIDWSRMQIASFIEE